MAPPMLLYRRNTRVFSLCIQKQILIFSGFICVDSENCKNLKSFTLHGIKHTVKKGDSRKKYSFNWAECDVCGRVVGKIDKAPARPELPLQFQLTSGHDPNIPHHEFQIDPEIRHILDNFVKTRCS